MFQDLLHDLETVSVEQMMNLLETQLDFLISGSLKPKLKEGVNNAVNSADATVARWGSKVKENEEFVWRMLSEILIIKRYFLLLRHYHRAHQYIVYEFYCNGQQPCHLLHAQIAEILEQ